ncbi:MAG: heterodisulfide reductase subunit, partial [Thermodesulfobacteriota bacterium]|nr:heterodisulfide reductase subunit [Thermodesulfobacteriota bacterium]
MGLAKRKAIYVQYAQAVPLKYSIDKENCIYFAKKGKCGACKKICPTGAVDFDQKEEIVTLNVGSVILSPGFEPFDPTVFDSYQYAKLPNVVTAMEFERVLSASGPTMGHLVRTSDHKEPKKIAWFQCVGSRDMNRCDNSYCSSVCCMYAIKEAVIAK